MRYSTTHRTKNETSSPFATERMDARALLTSQGWRGSGHSLHKTDDSIGLAKPILVSRKNNTLGIGRKNHVTSDQWWLNAFDEQLKSIDTSSKTSVVVQTKTTTKLDGLLTHGAGKYTGANALYACFVSGGLLHGTLKQSEESESADATPEAEVAPVRKESKEERRARREEKKRKKAKKAERLAKHNAAAVEALRATEGTKKNKDKSKKDKQGAKRNATTETKEERRARKEAKRKEKAKKEKRQKIEKG